LIKPIKEGIDYAFKNHKNAIISKNKNKIDEYLFDIVQTWKINIELLSNFIENSDKFSSQQKENLAEKIKCLMNLVEHKKNLKNEKQKISGKLLIDQQILEEFKRRNQENSAYFKEQIEEYQEILDKKEEFVKQFEKKFNEVQIYVQRQVKSCKNPDFDYLGNYEILNFINDNETLNKTKNNLQEEIRNIRHELANLTMENSGLKKLNESNSTVIDNENSQSNGNSQLSSIIQNYKKKIVKADQRNRELRAKLEILNTQLKNKEIAFNLKENNPSQEERKETYFEKQKPEDMTIIKDLNETNFNELIVNKTTDMINRDLWDISCIEKKAD